MESVYRLEAPLPAGEFTRLPFATLPQERTPPFPFVSVWPAYDQDRLRLLRAFDWFLSLPLDVVRLSLGFPWEVRSGGASSGRSSKTERAGNDGGCCRRE